MSVTERAANKPERPTGWLQVSLPRAIAAAILLAGVAALLYFVVLPRGDSARLVDTPLGDTDVSVGVHPGQLARDFEASNLEGLPVRLSEFRGRPVVINFWATWCTSCLAEMPALEEQRKAHEADGLAIVAVNVGERVGDAREFIEALELFEFVIAMDPALDIADAYAVRGLPHSLFLDSNGVIQAEYRGQLDDDTMAQYVQAAIAAVPAGEAPFRPRFVTTVPREHVLEVFSSETASGQVLFVSRRFRCDDDYCGAPALDSLGDATGIVEVDLQSEAAPPSLSVTFEPGLIELDEVVATVAEALRAHPDPLYTRDLEVRTLDSAP